MVLSKKYYTQGNFLLVSEYAINVFCESDGMLIDSEFLQH